MINYLCSSPFPQIKGTDAVYNEINTLHNQFGGSVHSLYPFKKPSSRFPILLYGVHNYRQIKKLEKEVSCHQVFAPSLFHIPILYRLKKPIIYNIVAGIGKNVKLPQKYYLDKITLFIVSNEADKDILNKQGIQNVEIVTTGIKTENFEKHSLVYEGKLNLLLASAPWEMKQFYSKGIHLIFEYLKSHPNVHIYLLWRDILAEHAVDLIKQYGIQDSISFINKNVNVNKYLKKVHGSILICNDRTLVKANPHSLIESIAAGKPVICSSNIPFSSFVKSRKCGVCLEEFNLESLDNAIKKFTEGYHKLSNVAYAIDPYIFSTDRVKDQYQKLYTKYNLV